MTNAPLLQKRLIEFDGTELDVKFYEEFGEIKTYGIRERATGRSFIPTAKENDQIIDLIAEAL